MAQQRISRVLCAADARGSVEALEVLIGAAEGHDAQALALVGDLGTEGSDEGLRALLHTLATNALPAFWVPGPSDAPIETYLREAANIEIVAPFLRGVHGTLGFGSRHVLFAGFGGEVSDDPEAPRDETDRLRYPRWEPEYHLKVVRELEEHQLVLLFSTPPLHEGLGGTGSEVLAELVGTYRPRLAVCPGAPASAMIGRSLVVAPGRLTEGEYAIADILSHEVEHERLPEGALH
jgi:Icc-related predicted phosphoesterase